jgi:hypothetical protein
VIPKLAAALLLGFTAHPADAAELFTDATETHLPQQDPSKFTMNAVAADLDGDGDLDLALAQEFAANRLLINAGGGCFVEADRSMIPQTSGDFEEAASADYDRDGDIDLVFAGEDDRMRVYFLNAGDGRFEDVSDRLPVDAVSNAVVAFDADDDGDTDLYWGNNGRDVLLLNDGSGAFSDASDRLPGLDDITQDVAVADVDGDGDLDLALGNEDGNVLLVNDRGRFKAAPLPLAGSEETRDAELADVDGDSDLDLFLANVRLFAPDAHPQNRLLLNDGAGIFTDVTADHLPMDDETTMTASFVDADRDGDLDLLTGAVGDLSGRTAQTPYRGYLNDGAGRFTQAAILPASATGNGFHIEIGDYSGDGIADAFLASRGGADRLLLGVGGAAPGDCAAVN